MATWTVGPPPCRLRVAGSPAWYRRHHRRIRATRPDSIVAMDPATPTIRVDAIHACLPCDEHLFSIVNVQSLPDDRTARAKIRDETLQLFGERGPDAVTVRDIAAAADVSPALVMRHYGSKDGLREAVDEHVARVFAAMLAEVIEPNGAEPFDRQTVPTLAEMVAANLPADSAIPAYLGRMLVTGGSVGSALFRRLHEVSRDALVRMTAAGMASAGADPEVRAAFLLVSDLAVVILRDRLREVLGVDPLSAGGMRRWGAEVLSIYRDGIGARSTGGERRAVVERNESR